MSSFIKKRFFSIYIIITLVTAGFIGTLIFDGLVDIGNVEATTIIVDCNGGGNYSKIQDAINNASSGDTIYVWAGTYDENLIVNKSVTLIGNGSENTIIDAYSDDPIIKITANWVNISGFNIKNKREWGVGLKIENVKYCNISNNNCSDHGSGIILLNSDFNYIFKNTIYNSNSHCLYIYNSSNNKFNKNLCSYNYYEGFSFSYATSNILINNTLIKMGYGYKKGILLSYTTNHYLSKNTIVKDSIVIQGNSLEHYNTHHIDQTNTVNGKSVFYFKNEVGKKITGYAGQVILINCSNMKIENQNLSNISNGILIMYSSDNIIANNSCNYNDGNGIYLESSNNNILINNTCSSNGNNGIYVYYSNKIIFENNRCSNNNYGICIYYSSNNNTFKNNSCNRNAYHGIYLNSYSLLQGSNVKYNIFINNTLNRNMGSAIQISMSKFNTFIKNKMINSGINIHGYSEHWNTHEIDQTNTINGKPVYYYKNRNGKKVPEGSGQVILASCSNISIQNQNLSDGSVGLLIGHSSYNLINNNICNSNSDAGIYLYNSYANTVENNFCNSNYNHGILLSGIVNYYFPPESRYTSILNIIKNNTCSNNQWGIDLSYYSSSNTLYNNSCSNNQEGIYLSGTSSSNKLYNNSCSNNYYFGISLGSSNNKINNNICSNNYYGISLASSNNIIDNNLFSNNVYGVRVGSSNDTLFNNSCKNNSIGISLWHSKYNSIENNTCLNNVIGIEFCWSSNNTIIENTLLNNNGLFSIDTDSNNNIIYHNNLISHLSHHMPITDEGKNTWYHNQEGNYWSDYKGSDNGFNGTISGDGIGDTEIPHHKLDYYPFMNISGWLYPGHFVLFDPGNVDIDGNYTISWTKSCRTRGYILEEDINKTFDSSIVAYNGNNLSFDIKDKSNGIYYYRLRAYNNRQKSDWSKITNIIVDFPPDVPQNLKVNVFPEGNALNLSWEPNVRDTIKYEIYYKIPRNYGILYYPGYKLWQYLDTVTHSIHTYNHTDLFNGWEYNYFIKAIDSRGQSSEASNVVSAIPEDTVAPKPPSRLEISSTSIDAITLVWKANNESDVLGYNIYRSTIPNPEKWSVRIGISTRGNESYIDRDVEEFTTYYYVVTAFDEVPNESEFSETVIGKTKISNYPPMIKNFVKNFKIVEDSFDNKSINLYHWFKDINGDKLRFRCEGQKHIKVTITSKDGSVLLIPEPNWSGKEYLIFYASDGSLEIADDVIVTVTPVNDPPKMLRIISPENGAIADTRLPIDFIATCVDPDVLYGDKLTFVWSSNISGELGRGESLKNIFLTAGDHKITLTVYDTEKSSINATINITVFAPLEPFSEEMLTTQNDTNENKKNHITEIITYTIATIIFLVIFSIILFSIFKKKKLLVSKSKKNEDFISQLKATPKKKPAINKFTAKPGQVLKTQIIKTSQISPKQQSIPSSTKQRSLPMKLQPVRPQLEPIFLRPLLPSRSGEKEIDSDDTSKKITMEEIENNLSNTLKNN